MYLLSVMDNLSVGENCSWFVFDECFSVIQTILFVHANNIAFLNHDFDSSTLTRLDLQEFKLPGLSSPMPLESVVLVVCHLLSPSVPCEQSPPPPVSLTPAEHELVALLESAALSRAHQNRRDNRKSPTSAGPESCESAELPGEVCRRIIARYQRRLRRNRRREEARARQVRRAFDD